MIRSALAIVLALLVPCGAMAAETGGVVLSPEAMASESQIVGQVASTMQQLRGLASATSVATAARQPVGGDDAAARSNVMAQDSASRQAQLAAKLSGRQSAVQLIDNSITVNAVNSPVTIGDGNTSIQSVSTSTAISNGGNALAQATASTKPTSPTSSTPTAQ